MLKLTAKRSKWFSVPQDSTGEAKIEILYLKPGQVADIEAKANNIIGKQSGDDFQTEIGFNLNERLKAYVTQCVINWKGFNNINDKPLKCTDINKLAVLKEFDWFGEFVEECRTSYSEEVAEEEETAGKN